MAVLYFLEPNDPLLRFFINASSWKSLPKVYAALDMKIEAEPKMPCYASMLKGYVKVDPYECILCKSRLVFRNFRVGNSVADWIMP